MFLKGIKLEAAVDGGAGGGAAANGVVDGGAQHWSSALAPEFTLDHDGKPTPAKDVPFVKETPDLNTLVKQAYDFKRVIGGGLTKIPGKEARPEEVAAWKKENFSKLAAAGLMELAPESADAYKIEMPAGAIEGVTWSNELVSGFKTLAKDMGLTQAQVDKIIEFDTARMTAAHKTLATTTEQAVTALKSKWGDKYDVNFEIASRGTKEIFKDDQAALALFDEIGLSNHPAFLEKMFEVGARMQESDGHLPGGGAAAGDPKADLATFMADKEKVHKWNSGDQAATAEYETIMKRIHGTKEVGA